VSPNENEDLKIEKQILAKIKELL